MLKITPYTGMVCSRMVMHPRQETEHDYVCEKDRIAQQRTNFINNRGTVATIAIKITEDLALV